MSKVFVLVAFVTVLSGCASISKGGYYWGEYSSSYFLLVKERSSESIAKRVNALEDIIIQSQLRGLRVPPGIHAELGMIYIDSGRSAEGLAQFDLEVEIYPESKPFIERLSARL